MLRSIATRPAAGMAGRHVRARQAQAGKHRPGLKRKRLRTVASVTRGGGVGVPKTHGQPQASEVHMRQPSRVVHMECEVREPPGATCGVRRAHVHPLVVVVPGKIVLLQRKAIALLGWLVRTDVQDVHVLQVVAFVTEDAKGTPVVAARVHPSTSSWRVRKDSVTSSSVERRHRRRYWPRQTVVRVNCNPRHRRGARADGVYVLTGNSTGRGLKLSQTDPE